MLLQRDLDRVKRPDPTTFDPHFLTTYFLNRFFTTFVFSFGRDGADLPLNQHDKDKCYSCKFE